MNTRAAYHAFLSNGLHNGVIIKMKLKFVLDGVRTTRLMHGKPLGLRVSDDFPISYGMLCNI